MREKYSGILDFDKKLGECVMNDANASALDGLERMRQSRLA